MYEELSKLLRSVRQGCGLPQLELALRLGISQRHLSFVEQGRARPSRALLLAWLDEVASPRPLRNAALLQAGYSPLEADHAMASSAVDDVLLRTIKLHQPGPGLVFDADWWTVQMNPAARWMCRLVMPELWTGEDRLDMLATLAHPCGWLARAHEPRAIAAGLLGQLRAEQLLRPALAPRIDALEQALVSRWGRFAPSLPRDPCATSFDVAFNTPHGPLAFSVVQAMVGLPYDANGGRLRCELWFPADESTAAVMRRHEPEMARITEVA